MKLIYHAKYIRFFCVSLLSPLLIVMIKNSNPTNTHSRPCNHDNYLNRQKLIESIKPAEIKILGYAE